MRHHALSWQIIGKQKNIFSTYREINRGNSRGNMRPSFGDIACYGMDCLRRWDELQVQCHAIA